MYYRALVVLAWVLIWPAAAKPTLRFPRHTIEPCAMVAASADIQRAAAPTATPFVSAKLAFDCLNSVPLGAPQATALMQALMPFLEWQSDIEYLAKPPAGYPQPAIDLRAAFTKITTNIAANVYKNEYDFQADLLRTTNLAYDGHFRFVPDLLGKSFSFKRPMALVSVSMDGKSSPKIFAAKDIRTVQPGLTPSALATIDGISAERFLDDHAKLSNLNDPDANYNMAFYSPGFAAVVPGWPGTFGGGSLATLNYPGPNTTFVFENGTSMSIQNLALVGRRFTNITNGASLYQKMCTGPDPVVAPPANATKPGQKGPQQPPPLGYPTPNIITSDAQVSGYYLPQSNVAVLSILSFQPDVPAEMQGVIEKFISTAKKDGKTKLLIDVAVNGGGLIFQGYDTFRQLFPQLQEVGNSQFRSSASFKVASEQISSRIPPGYNQATNGDVKLLELFVNSLNFRFDMNSENQPFPNLPAKFGPSRVKGDEFTNSIRWNFSDPLITTNTTFGVGMTVSGYGARANIGAPPPFPAADIVVITDGFCASTCSLFSEVMRAQGGVKVIAFGGRPFPQGSPAPMIQAVGGTKGANVFEFSDITNVAKLAFDSGTTQQQAQANWTVLKDLQNTLPLNRSLGAAVNARNAIRIANVADQTPAQFVFEPADCRLLYTPEMMQNVTNIWMAAAKAAWGDGVCASGSLPAVKTSGPEAAFSEIIGPTMAGAMQRVSTDGVRLSDMSGSFMREFFMKTPI